MNTKDHGIPHNCPRWYGVGIRKNTYQAKKNAPTDPDGIPDREQEPFLFPKTIECSSIENFLDSDRVSKPYTTKMPGGNLQYSKTVVTNVTKPIDIKKCRPRP